MSTSHQACEERLKYLEIQSVAINRALVDVVAGLAAGVDAEHLFENLGLDLLFPDAELAEAREDAQGMAARASVPTPTGVSASDINVSWNKRGRGWWAEGPHGNGCHGATPVEAVENLCRYLSIMKVLPEGSL